MSRRAGPLLVIVAMALALGVASLPGPARRRSWSKRASKMTRGPREWSMSGPSICPEPDHDGGFAGNGLEVVIPEGGFRGLGPLDRLEPAPTEAWYRYHVRLLIGTRPSWASSPGSPASIRHRVGAASHQPKARPAGPHGACSAHRGPKVLRQVRSRSAPTSITPTSRATAVTPLVAWGFTGAGSLALHRGARQAERPVTQQWILSRLARREAPIQRAGHRIPVPRRSEHQDPPHVAQRLLRWRLADAQSPLD